VNDSPKISFIITELEDRKKALIANLSRKLRNAKVLYFHYERGKYSQDTSYPQWNNAHKLAHDINSAQYSYTTPTTGKVGNKDHALKSLGIVDYMFIPTFLDKNLIGLLSCINSADGWLAEDMMEAINTADELTEIFKRMAAITDISRMEQNYNILFEELSDCVLHINFQGIIVALSGNALKKTINQNDIVGKYITDVVFDEDDNIQGPGFITNLLKDKVEAYVFLECIGGHRVHRLRSRPNKSFGAIVCLEDIHNIYSENKRLEEVETWFRRISESMHDIIYTLDINTLKMTYLSGSDEKITGFSRDETISRTIDQMITPETLGKCLEVLKEGWEIERQGKIAPDQKWTVEYDLYHKDGSIISCECNFSVLRDKHGNPTHLLGISRNINKIKKLQSDLEEAKKKLDIMNATIDECLIIWDFKEKKAFITPNATVVTGYSSQVIEQMFDQTYLLQKILVGKSMQKIRDMYARLMQHNHDRTYIQQDLFKPLELEYVREDGNIGYLEAYVNFKYNQDESPQYAFIGLRDITDRKKISEIDEKISIAHPASTKNPLGVCIVDEEGQILQLTFTANIILQDVFKIIGNNNIFDLIVEQDRSKIRYIIEKPEKNDKPIIIEILGNDSSSQRIVAMAKRSTQGNIIFVFRNVASFEGTKLHEYQKEAIRKHSDELVWITDMDCYFTYVSPSSKKHLGFESWEIMVKDDFFNLFDKKSGEALINAFASGIQAINNRENNWMSVIPVKMHTQSGLEKVGELKLALVIDYDGCQKGFIGITYFK
jgi:PAS domain S-box-containing protein